MSIFTEFLKDTIDVFCCYDCLSYSIIVGLKHLIFTSIKLRKPCGVISLRLRSYSVIPFLQKPFLFGYLWSTLTFFAMSAVVTKVAPAGNYFYQLTLSICLDLFRAVSSVFADGRKRFAAASKRKTEINCILTFVRFTSSLCVYQGGTTPASFVPLFYHLLEIL